MLTRNFRGNLVLLTRYGQQRYMSVRPMPSQEHEYTAKPEYPPIEDLSFRAKKKRQSQTWHEKVKQLSTVEEKLAEINMPKYYGYKAYTLTDDKFPYNVKPFVQYATRTAFQSGLPESYTPLKEKAKVVLEAIRSELEDVIGFELAGYRHAEFANDQLSPAEQEEIVTSSLLAQLNRTLLHILSSQASHLNEVEVDYSPRHEAFWFLGGIYPPKLVHNSKKNNEWMKPYADDPYDRNLQYIGRPYLANRHKHMLDPLLGTELNDLQIKTDDVDVPEFRYDPLTLGYMTAQRHATTVPGFWPGDSHEFGLLSYQRRSHAHIRDKYCAVNDLDEALQAQGILSSYAWLFGQACYQGFSVFNDVTYPLTTQTIITDGKRWSFFAYQLNTTLVHSYQVDTNHRYNQCWGTEEMQLYDRVDDDGKVHGLNDDVLLNLIAFYLNQPKARDIELKPYLCKVETRVANIVDDDRRVFMEEFYKHVNSNRPRHRLLPEIYQWEKIYKIDNDTRPMEAKRRPFELGQTLFKRRMDEHAPRYIPRAVRPGGPKSLPKFEATYYPSIRR